MFGEQEEMSKEKKGDDCLGSQASLRRGKGRGTNVDVGKRISTARVLVKGKRARRIRGGRGLKGEVEKEDK